ncbi:hypothetical protein B0H14DRAFT_2704728 [Mycena olivaceomarginata]|nr:hypothetical protein B0H14DRAFT_2704728 [Mycena olivaceomarginata]
MLVGFLLLLAASVSRGLQIPPAELTPRAVRSLVRYATTCDDDDDDDCDPPPRTKSQSSPLPSASTTIDTSTVQNKGSHTQATIVALACILGILLVTVVGFFFWRRAARRKQQGVRPYIEISEEDARPLSTVSQRGGGAVAQTEDPLRHLPPVRPFLAVEPQPMNYRATGDLRSYEEQIKYPLPQEGGAIGDAAGYEAPPPGYRPVETIPLT